MSFSDKDFINSIIEAKDNLILKICALDSHNFISKDALVEVVIYQNAKIRRLEDRETKDELLKDIKRVLNDVQNYKYKGVGELFRSLDVLEVDLGNFVNKFEMQCGE